MGWIWGWERVREPSGPPRAGELLQSDLESPRQWQSVRLGPSLQAACRVGWLTLTPRHRSSFLTEYLLIPAG